MILLWKRISKLYFLLGLGLFAACQNEALITITIPDKTYSGVTKVKASQFIDEVKTIRLESGDSIMIGAIDKITASDSLVYIMDKHFSKSIIIFDFQGKFKSKINWTADSASNLSHKITGFAIDPYHKELVVWDFTGYNICYSLNGRNVISTNKFEFTNHVLEGLNIGPAKFCYFSPFSSGKNDAYDETKFMLGTRQIERTGGFDHKEKWSKNITLTSGNVFSTYKGLALALATFSDIIYQLDSLGNCKERYHINVQERKIPKNLFSGKNTDEFMRQLQNSSYVFTYGGCFETDNYIIFPLSYHLDNVQNYYYHKKSKEVFGERSIIDNMPGLISYKAPVSANSKYLISYITANEVKEAERIINAEGIKKNADVIETMKQVKETDNPVLIFYKLK